MPRHLGRVCLGVRAFRDAAESKAAIGYWLLRPQDLTDLMQSALQKPSDFLGMTAVTKIPASHFEISKLLHCIVPNCLR